MRRLLRVWLPIMLLGLCLTLVYFRQWILMAKSISAIRDDQQADLRLLDRAADSMREIASLQMALRVKLFGATGAEAEYLPAPPAGRPALHESVIRAMGAHGVKLTMYRQKGPTLQVRVEGPFDGVVHFLETSGADLPQIDGFLMEGLGPNKVKLTMTFPAASA